MSSASPRALIVDDDKLIRVLTARALTAQRIACDQAEDGAAALKSLEESTYDIVVTDLVMPKRHGHSLCQEVLARADRPLLIVITGLVEPRLEQDLRARGVDAIFQKPIDFPTFGKRIRAMFDARQKAEQGTPQKTPALDDHPALAPEPPPKAVVTILMSDASRAQRMAQALRGDLAEVFVSNTIDSLSHFVHDHQVDILLIEDVHYGFFTGAEILKRLQEHNAPGHVIVVGEGSAFSPEQVQSLSIRRVFSPLATDSDIVQSVRNALAEVVRAAATTVSREAAALVKAFGGPVNSPAVLVKLTAYLRMPASEIPDADLARDIMADPATTAELLRLANSSSLGVRRQITEVRDALVFLGKGRSAALLVSSGIRNVERGLLRPLPTDLQRWYQLRTILIASVASLFAERHCGLSADTAFVLGLFQDMGILVLANSYGERYLRLIEQGRSMGPVRLHALEQQYYGTDHAEISAALLAEWRLPDQIVTPVRFHHDRDLRPGERSDGLAYVQPMRIGEAFANLWDNRHPTRKIAISKLLTECRSVHNTDYDTTLNDAVHKTVEVAQLYLLPIPNQDSALAVCKDVLSGYSELCDTKAPAPSAKQ